MEKILNQSHDRNTLFFATSRMFERAAYYGLLSLIVLYMTSETIAATQVSALSVYGWFTSSILFTRILGAFIGDFVIGNKWAIISGVILQILGSLSFCVGNLYGVYVGVALVGLGAGLYSPNIEARYGKWYLGKKQLMDAAFAILYFSTNLGAMFGTVCIAMLGEKFGWNIGFIASSVCFAISLILFGFTKKDLNYRIIKSSVSYNKYLWVALVLVIMISLFWTATEISHIKHAAFIFAEGVSWEIPRSIMQSMKGLFFLPLSIIVIITWSKRYSSSIFKIGIGFILGICAFVLFYFLPVEFSTASAGIYGLAILFLSISELYISPILKSYLVQISNPKYLAIILAIAIGPAKLLAGYLPFAGYYFIDNPQIGILISIALSALFASFVFLGLSKKIKKFELTTSLNFVKNDDIKKTSMKIMDAS